MDQPKIYLVDQVREMIVYGAECCYMSAENYVRAAVDNVEQNITKYNQRLPKRCKTPIISGYWSETDTLHELKPEGVTHNKQMFGVLRWSVEMMRVDILLETELMSTNIALI